MMVDFKYNELQYVSRKLNSKDIIGPIIIGLDVYGPTVKYADYTQIKSLISFSGSLYTYLQNLAINYFPIAMPGNSHDPGIFDLSLPDISDYRIILISFPEEISDDLLEPVIIGILVRKSFIVTRAHVSFYEAQLVDYFKQKLKQTDNLEQVILSLFMIFEKLLTYER